MARPKAILFDWDNTLVDNWASIFDALTVTFQAMGHPLWTFEEAKARVRASLRDSFPIMFGDRWEEARTVFYDRFEIAHVESLKPLPFAGDLLAAARAQGIVLGVVSNKTGHYLRRECDALGWTPHFVRIVGAHDAPADKPDPVVIHLALEGTGIAAGPDVWFVGDAAIDMRCAIAGGCVPVLVGQPPAEEDFTAARPVHHTNDLSQLARLLDIAVS